MANEFLAAVDGMGSALAVRASRGFVSLLLCWCVGAVVTGLGGARVIVVVLGWKSWLCRSMTMCTCWCGTKQSASGQRECAFVGLRCRVAGMRRALFSRCLHDRNQRLDG